MSADSRQEALAVIRELAADQRRAAHLLRDAIAEARARGVTWTRLGDELGMDYSVILRQYRSGSPIVVVRAHH